MDKLELDVLVMTITHPNGQRTAQVLGTSEDYDREVTIHYHPTFTDGLGDEQPAYTFEDIDGSVLMRGSEATVKDTLYRFHKKQAIVFNGEACHAPSLGDYKVELVTHKLYV